MCAIHRQYPGAVSAEISSAIPSMVTLIGAPQFWRLVVAGIVHIASLWRCCEMHMLRIAAKFHRQLLLGFEQRKFHRTTLTLFVCESIPDMSTPNSQELKQHERAAFRQLLAQNP